MPAALGRIPGTLVLEYVEVPECLIQMSMRPGVHIFAKPTVGHDLLCIETARYWFHTPAHLAGDTLIA